MIAKYDRNDENGEWVTEEINTENLDNDSDNEWTFEMIVQYLHDTASDGYIRNIKIA